MLETYMYVCAFKETNFLIILHYLPKMVFQSLPKLFPFFQELILTPSNEMTAEDLEYTTQVI